MQKVTKHGKFFIVWPFLYPCYWVRRVFFVQTQKYQMQTIILSCVCLWTRITLQHYVVSSCQNNEKFFPYFFSLFFRIGWMMNWRLSALFALQSHPFIQYNTIHGILFSLKLKRRMVIYLKTWMKKIFMIRIIIAINI